jgi:DNA repair protein RadC
LVPAARGRLKETAWKRHRQSPQQDAAGSQATDAATHQRLPPLYIRASNESGHDVIHPADANTIIESAEALLAYRLRRGVKILRDPWLLLRFIQIRLVSQPRPVFAVFFLDRNQRLIHFAELFHGEENEVKVYPKEVVRETLAWNAERLLCVRSDPAGDHQPTSNDLVAAGRVKRALDLLNIPLLDYVIVGQSLRSLRLRGVI